MRWTSRLSAALAGDDHVLLCERAVLGVEVEFRFAVLFVGTVTGEAVVREDGTDVPVEAERRRIGHGSLRWRR